MKLFFHCRSTDYGTSFTKINTRLETNGILHLYPYMHISPEDNRNVTLVYLFLSPSLSPSCLPFLLITNFSLSLTVSLSLSRLLYHMLMLVPFMYQLMKVKPLESRPLIPAPLTLALSHFIQLKRIGFWHTTLRQTL